MTIDRIRINGKYMEEKLKRGRKRGSFWRKLRNLLKKGGSIQSGKLTLLLQILMMISAQ